MVSQDCSEILEITKDFQRFLRHLGGSVLDVVFSDSEVVIALVALGAPVSHYAIRKLGSLVLKVGLDTCYALNTLAGWLWIALPAHSYWLNRKAMDMGIAFAGPTGQDFHAATCLAALAGVGDCDAASAQRLRKYAGHHKAHIEISDFFHLDVRVVSCPLQFMRRDKYLLRPRCLSEGSA